MKQCPELTKMIFHRGAGGDDPEFGLQLHGGFGSFGLNILDGLGFIKNNGLPLDPAQKFCFQGEKPVADDEQVKGLKLINSLLSVAGAKENDT